MLTLEQLDAFAAVFSVLSKLQVEPADEETIGQVVGMIDEWPLSGGMAGVRTSQGVETLKASRLAEETPETIRRDQDLMYGITASAKVPPFESVHRSDEGLVFEEQTLEVRQQYRALGLQAPRLNREPDDHIGLELNFLAHCCLSAITAMEQGAASAAERYVAIGAEFTRDHIDQWAPQMLSAAEEQAETQWLKGLEQLTLGALEEWNSALSDAGAIRQEGDL